VAAMKYPLFEEIINKYKHTSNVVFDWGREVLVEQRWFNLNMLLNDPNGRYKGVKTGQTPNAGSCLCSRYIDTKLGYDLIAVVIGTQSNKHRNIETTKLINWCISTKF
jgi:D-alanyl-D-alanine carboxypeptidase